LTAVEPVNGDRNDNYTLDICVAKISPNGQHGFCGIFTTKIVLISIKKNLETMLKTKQYLV